MQTKMIDALRGSQEAIAEGVEILRAGGLVAFPTETVYGLGANGLDAAACRSIYTAKGRPSDNPLILHVADMAMAEELAQAIPPVAEKLMAAFCPGPLTLILKRRISVPDAVTGGLSTVGIRMPEHEVARALIRAANLPVAAPSANLSGRPSPTTAEAVLRDLNGRIPLILNGGACTLGVESTIVDCAGERLTILRPGAITREMLAEIVGEEIACAGFTEEPGVPRAPGMKYRHYAPKMPLYLMEGAAEEMEAAFRREILRLQGEGKTVGVLASAESVKTLRDILPQEHLYAYGGRGRAREIATKLYEGLRFFDDTEVAVILAEAIEERGLGDAVMNRLRKASAMHSIKF